MMRFVGRVLCLSLLLLYGVWAVTSAREAAPPKVSSTQGLQAQIDAAKPGAVIEIPRGLYRGHLRIHKRLTLRGMGGIIDGQGKGKVIVVSAPGVVLEGLRVQNSGYDLGGPDSCIYLTPQAHRSILRKNHLRDCAFGIWTHEAKYVQVIENTVIGRVRQSDADRGNGIHLFDGDHLVVRDNVVRGARDGIYVSAVEDSLFERNHLTDLRYGVHYMFSYRNTLRNNVSEGNLTGFALMESRYMTVLNNIARKNSSHGILFRDAQYCKIEGNQIIENGEGMFFFSSTDNLIRDNVLRKNQVGAKIWAGTHRNQITHNAFIGNARQIFYVGTKDLVWGNRPNTGGNYWSDYMGWDQDHDGYGDRPYRCDSFGANLLYRYPAAVFLMRSPTLELLTHMERQLPLLKVPTVIDRKPLMRWSAAP